MGRHGKVCVSRGPRHLHIDERIVGHVKRIGYLAEKTAYGSALLTVRPAAGAHRYDDREYQKYDNSLIDSVHPIVGRVRTSHTRHDEQHGYRHGTPSESSTDTESVGAEHTFSTVGSGEKPRNQQAAEERIEQTCDGNEQMYGLKAPAADNGI